MVKILSLIFDKSICFELPFKHNSTLCFNAAIAKLAKILYAKEDSNHRHGNSSTTSIISEDAAEFLIEFGEKKPNVSSAAFILILRFFSYNSTILNIKT